MSERKKEKKNEKMIMIGEKPAENVKMKKIIEKRFSKKKENFDTMMFEVVDVKDSNARIFIKYYIDDRTTISDSFTKFFSEFESFLRKKDAAQTQKKKQKKKFEKKTRTEAPRRRRKRK